MFKEVWGLRFGVYSSACKEVLCLKNFWRAKIGKKMFAKKRTDGFIDFKNYVIDVFEAAFIFDCALATVINVFTDADYTFPDIFYE